MSTNLGKCQEWDGWRHKHGYGNRKYKGSIWLAHRAAWDEQVGPIPEGMFVLHKCDNRLCVRVSHLFLGTGSDNMKDMVAKGRQLYNGSNNNRAILSEDGVRAIRAAYTGTKRNNPNFVSQTQLATQYGVSQAHISKIIHGKNWTGRT